jgi:hypothetical protein
MKAKKYMNGGVGPRLVNPTDKQLKRQMRRAYRRGGAGEAMDRLDSLYRMPEPESGEDLITGEELRALHRGAGAFPALGSLGALVSAYHQAKELNNPYIQSDPGLKPGPIASLLQRIMGMTQ